MTRDPLRRRRPSCRPGLALLAGALAACLAPASAAASSSVSGNWAGYVASTRGAGASFSSVSGVWTQPAVSCFAGRETFSAVWVGLGGYREGARALEQVGTDADCTRSGRAAYALWYELLPAAPVSVRIGVRPGDQLVAAATVAGRHVTFGIRDLTSGARFAKTVRAGSIDLSSAEWIVEAPSACSSEVSCHTLSLADFGQAAFAHATATAGGRSAPAGNYDVTALELQQHSFGLGSAARRPQESEVLGVPSALSVGTGAFSVSWLERQLGSELPPAPTFPGD